MSNERFIRDLIEIAWNGAQLDRLPDFYHDTFDHHDGRDTIEGLRAWHEQDAATWADSRYTVVDVVDGGDRVAVRWRVTARQIGQWGPVPATGKTITWEGVHFFTVTDGKISAMFATADVFGKAMQLGATLTPPPH